MPETKMSIANLSKATKALPVAKIAMGIQLSRLQYLIPLTPGFKKPKFTAAQEPLADGKVYHTTSGERYYRPVFGIAQRSGTVPGPEVRFVNDAESNIWLQFELEELPPSNLSGSAEPLMINVERMSLQWEDGASRCQQKNFEKPSFVATDDPHNPVASNFKLRIGAKLDSNEVESIFAALSTPSFRTALQVVCSFEYEIVTSMSSPSASVTSATTATRPLLIRPLHVASALASCFSTIRKTNGTTPSSTSTTAPASTPSTGSTPLKPVLRLDPVSMHTVIGGRISVAGTTIPGVKKGQITRTIPFTFDRQLEQNAPIYQALIAKPALQNVWMDTVYGFIKPAPFPNTLYRLPDEIRLAFSPDIGIPHVVPALYRDDDDEIRVRVVLRAVPWHNPEKLMHMSDFLFSYSKGELACPMVAIGGYERATLRFTGAFPEHIRTMGESEIAVSIENGFEVTLDLTLEFYSFLANLLTGSVGITGEVTVVISKEAMEEGGRPVTVEKRIPVRLNFDDLATLPFEIEVEKDALCPKSFFLTNKTGVDVRIGSCLARLLQVDNNSIAPLDIIQGSVTTPEFPALLSNGERVTISVRPEKEDETLLWNALKVELVGEELTQDASAVLEKIHEIAPQGALSWKCLVECPFFTQTTPDPRFAELYRIRIKIYRDGLSPQIIVLGPNQISKEVTIQRTFKDLVGDNASDAPSFNYMVQNIYIDHEGVWSEERENTGDFFVFPNPPEGD